MRLLMFIFGLLFASLGFVANLHLFIVVGVVLMASALIWLGIRIILAQAIPNPRRYGIR